MYVYISDPEVPPEPSCEKLAQTIPPQHHPSTPRSPGLTINGLEAEKLAEFLQREAVRWSKVSLPSFPAEPTDDSEGVIMSADAMRRSMIGRRIPARKGAKFSVRV